MARARNAGTKKPRRNKFKEEIERLKQQVLHLDRTLHDKEQEHRRELERTSFIRNNFSLVTTILNTARFNLKQLARQAAKDCNPVMACVFEFLYADLADLDKYKRLMKHTEPAKEEPVKQPPPVDFGIPTCDQF